MYAVGAFFLQNPRASSPASSQNLHVSHVFLFTWKSSLIIVCLSG